MKFSHKKDIPVLKIITIAWVIFSIFFIGRSLWYGGIMLTYQKGLQDGAQQGYVKAFSDIATAAANKSCQPFPLNVGTDEDGKAISIPLINLNCIKQKEQTTATTTKPKDTQ